MPSDLMRRLQPRKKMPKTTVSESTHMTAICTTRMMYRLRSSGPPSAKPSSVTTDAWVQQRTARSSASLLLAKNRPATSVWLPSAGFIAGAGGHLGGAGPRDGKAVAREEQVPRGALTCRLACTGTASSLLSEVSALWEFPRSFSDPRRSPARLRRLLLPGR